EDLGLVRKATEGFRVNDPVPIALVTSADVVFSLEDIAALALGGQLGAFGERVPFQGFTALSD
ncbi:MAG: hypothetical protein QOK47_1158, partial [Actinomycetota bacterium]|nr:hypothetical protein [Actinomycetota bacterium]